MIDSELFLHSLLIYILNVPCQIETVNFFLTSSAEGSVVGQDGGSVYWLNEHMEHVLDISTEVK